MSETSARASRRPFWLGSFARNGLRERLTPPAGVAPLTGVEATGVPRDAGAVARGVGDCGDRAAGAAAGDWAPAGGATGAIGALCEPTAGVAVVGRMLGVELGRGAGIGGAGGA